MATRTLLNAVTVDGAGPWVTIFKNIGFFSAKMSNVASAECSINIEFSPDGGTTVAVIDALTPSGAEDVDHVILTNAPGDYRMVVSGLTGSTSTGLSVTGKVRY